MHRGYTTPLVIAIMAFAVVAFLFLIDTAINPDGTKKTKNTNILAVNKNTNAVICTDDAKICPDGSAVGRSGPDCKFKVCPSIQEDATPVTTNTALQLQIIDESTATITSFVDESEEPKPQEIIPEPEPENNQPIKNIENISSLFPNAPEEGFRVVNVMGDRALIGGGKYLYLYDGSTVTDLSPRLESADPAVNEKILITGKIGNNGSSWLIGTTRVGERVHLYSFDGTTWTDLTEQLLSAVPNTVTGGLSFSWNGSYWLIAHNPGHLVKYDGQTFVDLMPQIPNPENNVTIMDMEWNGSYFLFTMLGPANHGRVYKYDGSAFTRLTEFPAEGYITNLGWNDDYWLLGGFNGQALLKYDGTTISDTGFTNRFQVTIAPIKKNWLVSGSLFDGEKYVDGVYVPAGYDVSVGKKYGIALGYKTVYRFTF